MLKYLGIILGVLLSIPVFSQVDSVSVFLPDTFQYDNPDHFIQFASKLTHEKKLKEAKQLIDFGLNTFPKDQNEHTWAILNFYLADYYYYKQEYNTARDTYSSIIPALEELHDTLFVVRAFNSIGLIYGFEQEYEKSLNYYLKGIDLLEEMHNRSYIIERQKLVVQVNIINLSFRIQDDDRIIKDAPKALKLAIELADSMSYGNILNALGVAYKNKDNFKQALKTYLEASSIYRKLNDEFRNAFILNNIGSLYESYEKYDSSLYYYKQSLHSFEKEDYKRGIVNSKLGIAANLVKLDQIEEARLLYNEVVTISTDYHFNDILLLAYSEMADIEYDQDNYKKAYEINQLYGELNDSIYTLEKQKQYAELQTKYETSQKENEINVLKNEKLIHEFKLKQNQLEKRIGLGLIIILLFTLYVIFLFYRGKNKANKLLIEKNTQIELQNHQLTKMNNYVNTINKKLRRSSKELTIANNSKNRFFSILAHDLRNPFHNVIGLTYLLSHQYDRLSHDERVKYANEIHESSNMVSRLLENLLEWSRTQTNEIVFQPVPIDLKKIVDDAISVLQQNAREKSIRIENNIEQSIKINADPTMLETVYRNLVNNSIKFTPNGGKIAITSVLNEQKLYACIEDNGVGIEKKNLKKIFNIDSKLKTKGTNNERGTGLGLVICKEFINYHKGKIWTESEPGKGSKFQFEIPVNPPN